MLNLTFLISETVSFLVYSLFTNHNFIFSFVSHKVALAGTQSTNAQSLAKNFETFSMVQMS